MAHTHPKRIASHTTEVNYYPSYEDLIKPIKENCDKE